MTNRKASKQAVLVTGYGGAIGSAVAQDLSRAGFAVAGISRAKNKGDVSVRTYSADVSSVDSLRQAKAEMEDDGIIPSHVVTCAAAPGASTSLLSSSEADWGSLFSVDVFGVVNVARVFGQDLIRAAGSLTNLTSFHTFATYPNRVAYVAAKSAVEGLSKGLAVEWGAWGVRVNCVAPGPIESPRTSSFLARDTDAREGMISRTPLGRLGSPEDVASVVTFLVSEKSRHITGQTLVVDGGWTSNAWWGDVSGGKNAHG